MKTFEKILYITGLLIAITLAVSLIHTSYAYSTEQNIQDKAFLAMNNLIGLDMEKYKAELTSNTTDQPEIYGGLTRETLTFTINADGSRAQLICTFINKTLTRCIIYPLEGSLLYAKPLSSNIITATNDFLQRYHAFSGAEFLQQASNILGTVTEIKTMNTTLGNLKLQITKTDDFVDFTWWHTVSGIDFPLWLSVEFANGELKGFSDRSSFYHIGSDEVNISQEQAIQITRDSSKNYTTLKASNEDGTYTEVTFNLTDKHMVAELQVANREPLTMYPLWYVRFYFEQPYGGTDGFQAGIWADTGEIAYAQLIGHHGIITDENSSMTPSMASSIAPSPDTQQSKKELMQFIFIYALATITVTLTAITILRLRKRRRK